MVGVGRGAQAGVLIRNAEALERMERVDTLVVDKTGTLTEGKPGHGDRRADGYSTKPSILKFAAASRARSEHPLAAAIVERGRERGISLPVRRTSTRPPARAPPVWSMASAS